MFKPNADHIEELMRAREICLSVADEITEKDSLLMCVCQSRLKKISEQIDKVLAEFCYEAVMK